MLPGFFIRKTKTAKKQASKWKPAYNCRQWDLNPHDVAINRF